MRSPGRTEGKQQQHMTEDKEPSEPGNSKEDKSGMTEEEIDRNLAETFPASDPPSWTLGTDHVDETQDSNADEDEE